MGEQSTYPFVPSAFVVFARGMKALLALRKGLVNHLAHTQETVSIGASTQKALFRVASGDMYCSQLLVLNQQKWRLNGKERLLESGKSRSWALIGVTEVLFGALRHNLVYRGRVGVAGARRLGACRPQR